MKIYRKCEVDGDEAYFHDWTVETRPLLTLKARMPLGHRQALEKELPDMVVLPDYVDVHITTKIMGIVEMSDGQVNLVEPETIRFLKPYWHDLGGGRGH